MPIYEYTCDRCHQACEILVRSQESPVCPHCGGKQLQKQLSVPAAHSSSSREVPICQPQVGCGRPQCGSGGCAFD